MFLGQILKAQVDTGKKDSAHFKAKLKKAAHFTADLFVWKDPHSPTKAGIYAAVIPGLGQIYNRKYWKTPIVWAALGGAAYYTYDNRAKMRKINDTLRQFYIKHKDTLNANTLHIAQRDKYRQKRDLGILVFTGLYVLQIIDATVDAHFYHIDIHQNLSFHLRYSPYRFVNLQYQLHGSHNPNTRIFRGLAG